MAALLTRLGSFISECVGWYKLDLSENTGANGYASHLSYPLGYDGMLLGSWKKKKADTKNWASSNTLVLFNIFIS